MISGTLIPSGAGNQTICLGDVQTVDLTRSHAKDAKAASMRTIVAASAVGTTIEWYDFLIYATAAALVLNKLFSRPKTP